MRAEGRGTIMATKTSTDVERWDSISDEEVDTGIPAMASEKDTFASIADFTSTLPTLDVFYVKEMNKSVRLRYLTAAEVDRYRQSLIVGKGNNMQINQKGARAKLVVMALANEDGTRMLADINVSELMKWPSILLERISDRIKVKNGIMDDDLSIDDSGN
jgi:hypothetical protein